MALGDPMYVSHFHADSCTTAAHEGHPQEAGLYPGDPSDESPSLKPDRGPPRGLSLHSLGWRSLWLLPFAQPSPPVLLHSFHVHLHPLALGQDPHPHLAGPLSMCNAWLPHW